MNIIEKICIFEEKINLPHNYTTQNTAQIVEHICARIHKYTPQEQCQRTGHTLAVHYQCTYVTQTVRLFGKVRTSCVDIKGHLEDSLEL